MKTPWTEKDQQLLNELGDREFKYKQQRDKLLERIKYINSINHGLDSDAMHRALDELIAECEGKE